MLLHDVMLKQRKGTGQVMGWIWGCLSTSFRSFSRFRCPVCLWQSFLCWAVAIVVLWVHLQLKWSVMCDFKLHSKNLSSSNDSKINHHFVSIIHLLDEPWSNNLTCMRITLTFWVANYMIVPILHLHVKYKSQVRTWLTSAILQTGNRLGSQFDSVQWENYEKQRCS